MAITKTEEYGAWLELLLIHTARFSLAAFTFPVVPCFLFVKYGHWFFLLLAFSIPIAMILKYVFGVKDLWLLNDTVDGDFGDPVEIDKKNYEDKSSEFLFLWWYSRNFNWNLYRKFLPDFRPGAEVFEEDVRINTTNKKDTLLWCKRGELTGKNYTLFRVFEGGKVYFRWSWANHRKEIWFGAGGTEYKFRMKPIF